TGVSGAGVEIAGLRLSRRWWRRFTRAVVEDARRQGLCRRRWGVVVLALPLLMLALTAMVWWSAVRSGSAAAVVDSLWPRAAATLVAVVMAAVLWRLVRRARSSAQRPTGEGLRRAAHWMSLRAWMEPRGFEGASSGTANNATRALAYAAGLGLAERACDELPIVPEDDRLAWSNATGEWHVVRVRYPFRPGYGRHPALMLVIGLVLAAGLWQLHRLLMDVARSDALQGLVDDFPDQAELIERIALVLAAIVIVPLAWSIWLAMAGSFDLFSTIRRQGVIVRARRPRRVLPLPRLLAPLARRERFALFIAVDDGRSDLVRAWLANERTAVPQGARARVHATPVLGYVRKSEPIGTTRTTVELPD
ncbi:MAG: hypothetical protein H0W46_10890, partial [Acidimicrobiia bacterium]|nr:hypothetical protein [Acidimicrobiia bacterium]